MASRRTLKRLIKTNKVQLLVISEPKIPLSQAGALCHYLKLHGFAGNDAKVIHDDTPVSLITAVYAACNVTSRRELFQSLLDQGDSLSLPWLVGGDFNCVTSGSEKKGGALAHPTAMLDFNSFISAAGLLDAGLCVKHLPRGPSDHAPLLLNFVPYNSKASRFIFQKMWTTHENFLQCIRDAWTSTNATTPNPFVALQSKLKATKIMLKTWNKNIFGNIEDNVRSAEDLVTAKQLSFDDDPSTANREGLNAANAKLRRALMLRMERPSGILFPVDPLETILTRPYHGPSIAVREVILDDHHPIRSLIAYPSILDDIQLSDHLDRCVWTGSPGGAFTTSSAYRNFSSHGVIRKPMTRLWHHSFYHRASLFCWRLLYRTVLVDSRIVDQGIALPSLSSCCSNHNSEDLNHLFITSELATDLWNWAAPMLEVNLSSQDNITARLWHLVKFCNMSTPHGYVSLYVSMLVIWEIWRCRCSMRFEGKRRTIHSIVHNIRFMISTTLASVTFNHYAPGRCSTDLCSLGFAPLIKNKSFKLVRWIPPESGLVLNVDGASKGNPGHCGGGGCIRDSSGSLILAFSHYYGFGGSLVAEVRALCDGIRLATEYDLPLSQIQSDSASLVASLTSGSSPAWDCMRWWIEAHKYIRSSTVQMVHVYRETNQVADALANLGCKSLSNIVFSSPTSLPRECRGPLTMDRSGLPSLRIV
ncbi:hypothetical protein Taro_045592 [Colocasia esculenta]|uniref:RNase H type-1 domain-containing protein n=1 Tax=Colocasia esculenta TaxID=4460 RepID=A0A843WPW2_COLES|nr:hypothetical protein [Colocasia esculenta]